MRPLHSPKL